MIPAENNFLPTSTLEPSWERYFSKVANPSISGCSKATWSWAPTGTDTFNAAYYRDSKTKTGITH